MPTTPLRIEDSLMKQRVAAAAERAGKTAHALIVDATAETVEQAEMEWTGTGRERERGGASPHRGQPPGPDPGHPPDGALAPVPEGPR